MDGLFEIPDGARVEKAPPEPPRSLAERQAAKVQAGLHPLPSPGHPVWLHKMAAPLGKPYAPGLRCGDCRFRELLLSGGDKGRRVPKCTVGDGTRMTHSVASDVRALWPACREYKHKTAEPDEKTA